GPHGNNRPNQEPFGFTVRLRVTKVVSGTTLTGQDRRNLYLHRDSGLLAGWPKTLASDGASSPALADLDGDNRNELILGTSDGTVHAFRRDGSELPGWPVRGDPLPIHPGQHAFGAGGVPEDLSHGAMLSSPAVADIDHDGAPEVVIADMEGKVYVWGADGRLEWEREANPDYSGKPLSPFVNVRRGKRYRTQHGFIASPVIADLDSSGDGRLEVVAAGMDRHVYAWHSGGAPVGGYPVLVVDRDKITAVDPVTHAPTFRTDIGDELNQGSIVDTPAVADLDGDGKPEIVVGTNEEYPAPDDGGLNSGVTAPSGGLLDLLQAQIGLGTGNTRVYAIKPAGDPGDVALDNSIFLWRFKVGVLLTELLPVVGEGVTGAPVVATVSCGGNTTDPKVGVSAAAGFAYLIGKDGKSCLGQSNGKDNPLAIEFAAGTGKYDTPSLAAVGQGSFGQLDPVGGPAFLTPVAGILRALDAAVNDYQGGQDFLGAWNTDTGQFRPGWPTPVNDLSFLTGPSTADIDGLPGEEALGGTASLDLNAFSAAGTPASGFPKFTADWMVTNPAIGSFGTDETDAATHQTVIAATRAGTVFAYDTAAPACSPASWPRFHHDNANSGSFERDAVSPGKPYAVSAAAGAITFRAPGDDLLCGRVDHYEAVTSIEPPAADLSGGTSIPGPAPVAPGGTQTLTLPATVRRYVAFRAVDEQGNVGRAVVIDRGAGANTPPGGGGPGGGRPTPGERCNDAKAPRTKLGRRALTRSKRRARVRGRTRDRGCAGVKRIDVMVARLVRGHRCRFVRPNGRLTHVRRCSRPIRLHPRVRARWTLRIRHRLPRGHYQVTARATDAARNHEKRAKRNRVRRRLR
ncbi:MAG: hypothetical protein QOG63_2577, partial [Thermoleophilaceae bacterium]|nr:hypothetical protein [Thermoleophilaceae bacterium]